MKAPALTGRVFPLEGQFELLGIESGGKSSRKAKVAGTFNLKKLLRMGHAHGGHKNCGFVEI
jgi:hypothetical protein